METIDYLGIAGFVISIVSLGFATFIYFKHDKRIKSQELLINEYQLNTHKDAEIEKKKAIVKANIINRGKGSYRIKIFNSGQAVAKNIRVEMSLENGQSLEDELAITANPFPFAMLSPHDSAEISFMAFIGSPDAFYIKTIWDDQFEENRENVQFLQMV